MYDVLTFGETMVVLNPEAQGPFRHVPTFRKSIGGAESNVAIGLARLGRKAAWVSKVSGDELGEYVVTVIRGEGVDVSHVGRQEGGFTGLILKERFAAGDPNVYFWRRGAAASTMTPGEFPYQLLKSTRVLHATGIFPALSPSARETACAAFAAAREAGVAISFDPNLRRKLWSPDEARPVLLDLAARCDILLPGMDEAELLVGPGAPEGVLQRCLDLGPRVVALKLGAGALVGVRGQKPVRIEQGHLVPVDSVGAGDAFAAAFLAWLAEDRSPEEAGRAACAAGALATQVAGDYEGAPFRAQLDRYLAGQTAVTR